MGTGGKADHSAECRGQEIMDLYVQSHILLYGVVNSYAEGQVYIFLSQSVIGLAHAYYLRQPGGNFRATITPQL
jgi:hypothetical protein